MLLLSICSANRKFLIIAVAIPIIAVIATNKVGSLPILIDQVPESHTKVFSHPQFFEYLCYFLASALPIGILTPLLIQRYLMSSSTEQNQKITCTFAIVKVLLLFALLIHNFLKNYVTVTSRFLNNFWDFAFTSLRYHSSRILTFVTWANLVSRSSGVSFALKFLSRIRLNVL